jgi:hypothetical protein
MLFATVHVPATTNLFYDKNATRIVQNDKPKGDVFSLSRKI